MKLPAHCAAGSGRRVPLRFSRRLWLTTMLTALAIAALLTAASTVRAATGRVVEFSAGIPEGRHPGAIVAGPDDNLWFTEEDGVGRITPTGSISVFPFGTGGFNHPNSIAAGRDGNLWFTDDGGIVGTGAIVRMTPAGVMTEFSQGISEQRVPDEIAASPDGSLWFTEAVAAGDDIGVVHNIGRIAPDGAITELPIRTRWSPGHIVAGRDATLWFTEGEGLSNVIGRITPAGVVTEFSAGITQLAHPDAIAAGPHGSIWFTEDGLGGARIGRITASGKIDEFSAGISAGRLPTAITDGPDGNIWFTENSTRSGSRIARITPAGRITEFPAGSIGFTGNSAGIATGADGNLWFTKLRLETGAIGRLTPKTAHADTAKTTHCTRSRNTVPIGLSGTNYPNVIAHMNRAIAKGWPRTLVLNRPGAAKRHNRLKRDRPTRPGLDNAEYPLAIGRGRGKGLTRGIRPTGWKAHVERVPAAENRSAESTVNAKLSHYCDGVKFRIVAF
jgi:streptogramin lyase